MEYGVEILHENSFRDYGYIKHPGYSENNPCIEKYFSIDTMIMISKKVTQLTMGVDPQNRPIVVPHTNIYSVMNDIYANYRPSTGDIFSRYIVPSGESTESYVQNMIDQVIEVIVTDIRNNMEMDENNRKLSVWTTVYGDFNTEGLRQHPPIKVRNRHPAYFQFNMNY